MPANETKLHRFNFTEKEIENLPSCDPYSSLKSQEYLDEECPGLCLYVTKNGRKTFAYKYTFKKKKRIVEIGKHPIISVQQARKIVSHTNLITQPIDPSIWIVKQKTPINFQDFVIGLYLPAIKGIQKGWFSDCQIIHKCMIPVFGNKSMATITEQDVQSYLETITSQYSGFSVNRHIKAVKQVFFLAFKWNCIPENPCYYIHTRKGNQVREIFLKRKELGLRLKPLGKLSQRVSERLFKFLAATGKGLKEILSEKAFKATV